MAAAGVTCRRCLGRIDEEAHRNKRKIHDQLQGGKYTGKPYEPPHLCSECWWIRIVQLVHEDDEEKT